MSHVESAE